VILLDITGVLLAHAFSFHSRINEWGEDDEQRWSYRKLLMIATVAPTWLLTASVVAIELLIPVLPPHLDTGSDQLRLLAFMIYILLMPIALACLPFLLYFNRPVGTVNRSQDDCWKFGLFYFNPRDGAWVVPARLGAGIALNFGQPLAWILILISITGLGVRRYPQSSTANYEPNDSVQAQFATATRQLSGGEFAGSERLLYIARHTNDPAVWSSVAYELTVNHVKPDSALQWAKRAVTQGESLSSQTNLAMPNARNWEAMTRLAAYWSNLGYVCSWQGDLDCAQRNLEAAWALDPLPAYGNELAVVLKAVSKPQDEKATTTLKSESRVPARQVANVSVPGSKAGAAYFDARLSEKETAEIRWVGGDESLSRAAESIGHALNFPWPDDAGNEKVQIREKLTCTGVQSVCQLVILSPEEAITVPEQAVN